MEFKAVQKYVIGSPRKMREVVYLIKNQKPASAIERLPFTGKKAAEVLKKVIMTAIANAKQKGINPEDLIFKEIQINEGPRLKRFQAGARGRAKPYKKRMSHIRVVLITLPKVDRQKSADVKKPTDEKKKTAVRNPKAVSETKGVKNGTKN